MSDLIDKINSADRLAKLFFEGKITPVELLDKIVNEIGFDTLVVETTVVGTINGLKLVLGEI